MNSLDDRVYRELKEIHEKVTRLRIDIAELKVKAGIWGLLGGLIPVVGLLIIRALNK